MPCPRCSSALHGMRSPAGPVWDCPHGHGRFALLSVLRGLVRRTEVDAAWHEAHWGTPRTSCRCPSCRRNMAGVQCGGFEVDVCRPCKGLWLDQVEVASLPSVIRDETIVYDRANHWRRELAILQVKDMHRRHQEGDPISGAPDETWKQLIGVLGFPVEVGTMATRNRPWVTWGICLIISIISISTLATGLSAAVQAWGFIPAEPFRHAGLTWITAFFLHGGLWHLLGNLWFLWLTGDNVEDTLGWRRYLLLILAASIAGDCTHLALDPNSTIPCIGASGGISGVLAAYAIMFPKTNIGFAWFYGKLWLRFPAWAWIAFWTLCQVWLAWQQAHGFTNVSAFAHLGGLGMGAMLTCWWRFSTSTSSIAQPSSTT